MTLRHYKDAEVGNINPTKKAKEGYTYLHLAIIPWLFPPLPLCIKEFVKAIEMMMIQRDECPGALIKRCVKSSGHCAW